MVYEGPSVSAALYAYGQLKPKSLYIYIASWSSRYIYTHTQYYVIYSYNVKRGNLERN